MFPVNIDLENLTQQVESESMQKHIGRSFLFNFSTGQHSIVDGAVMECDELTAIKQWLELMCRTTLDKYEVYQGSVFGTSAETFIGSRTLPKGFVASELEREIKECVKLNPAIDTVGNFKIERTTRGMIISFTAYLENKELLEVNVSV